MREGEGSILGTSEFKKSLKIDIFVSLCDNSAHKRAGKKRIQWIVKICQVWEQNKICNIFPNKGGAEQCLGHTL